MHKKKLIEAALPLETINRESAREKSIRHGHPSTLHLWWARRPLAAARAVLFAQLVDDPSARPDEFPTEELQRKERERLHNIIERLVVWENVRDEKLLAEARAEIMKSCGGHPPPIVDPFAGGGTIPLEAQRLGLEARASDLNPVAVLINKALIEIPPKFRDQPPVFPGLAESEIRPWKGAAGLAADVRAYGAWMRDRAEKRIGHLYPKATLPDGSKTAVIAWIWARTVTCPNPACHAEVPLLSSLDLSTKKDRERWLRPIVVNMYVDFEIAEGPRTASPNKQGQGAHFTCWVCDASISPNEIHEQLDTPLQTPRPRLLAVVARGKQRREYLRPTESQLAMTERALAEARIIRSADEALRPTSRGTFGGNAQGRRYGFFTFADYFTDRQLIALTTFSDIVAEAHKQVIADGGSSTYADAVSTYLAMAISKLADRGSSIVTWFLGRESTRNTFARQAIPMTWDFAEPNQFAEGTGSWRGAVAWTAEAMDGIPQQGTPGIATTENAATRNTGGSLISTDPPYYDNIGYSDLSDFFYVWLRRTLRQIYPELLSTMLAPKAEELVANSYRHGSKDEARRFFQSGFRKVFTRARESAFNDFPITVYYAFKQSKTNEGGETSTGWETLLEGMIHSGWEITSTWPMRSELSNRMLASGTNALASSIVLSLRPRPEEAPTTDRRGFISALESELPDALRRLQEGLIAPVDLPQAAIGPGMAMFSRYSGVVEPDGSKMTVRGALTRINAVLDQVLSEQEGEFDPTTRWAIAWYRVHGFEAGKYGEAELLASARGTIVQTMDYDGVLISRAGKVQLVRPADTPASYDALADAHISTWEVLMHLIRILEAMGVGVAGAFLATVQAVPDGVVEADLVKELAHLLFRIADKNSWSKDALVFNTLVTSWPDIVTASRSQPSPTAQGELNFDGDDE